MGDFEKWFEDQDFYTNMRFIHGDNLFSKDGDVYRVLPVQMACMAYQERPKPLLGKPFNFDLLDSYKEKIEGLEKRISKTLDMLEGDLSYVEEDRRRNFDFLQMAMIRCLKDDIKALRGES